MILNPLSLRNETASGIPVSATYDPVDRDITLYATWEGRQRRINDYFVEDLPPQVMECAKESLNLLELSLIKLCDDYPLTVIEHAKLFADTRARYGIKV